MLTFESTRKDVNDSIPLATEERINTSVANSTDLQVAEEFNNDTMSDVIDIGYVDLTSDSDERLKTTMASSFLTNEVTSSSLWTLLPDNGISVKAEEDQTGTSPIWESTTTLETDEVTVFTSWFVLILDGNCSLRGDDLNNLQDIVSTALALRLQTNRKNLHIQNTSCSSPDQMHINVTITGSCNNLSALLMFSLLHSDNQSSSPLVRIEHHDYYVDKIQTAEGYLLKVEPDTIPVDMKHSDVELIVYIAVGSACAFFVVLIVGLLMYKYCDACRDSSHKPDYFIDYQRDTSHNSHVQNMHLEDYTLTRIPRPKLAYVDYYRGMPSNNNSKRYSPLDEKSGVTSPNGMVQPFDTSVVPLEDDSQGRDEIIVRPMDIRRYGQGITRFYRNGRGLKSPAKRDINGTSPEGFYQARSVENLQDEDHTVHDRGFGVDNPVYQ